MTIVMTQLNNSQRKYQSGLMLVGLIAILLCALWGASIFAAKPSYAPPNLTDQQKRDLSFELDAAQWARDRHQSEESLTHFYRALDIDKGNPEILRQIELLQKARGAK
jgi:hypothetical protein